MEGIGNFGGGMNGGGGFKNWGMDYYMYCDKLLLVSELWVVIYLVLYIFGKRYENVIMEIYYLWYYLNICFFWLNYLLLVRKLLLSKNLVYFVLC